MMKKIIWLFMLGFFGTNLLLAQQFMASGIVMNKTTGLPVAFASVSVKDTHAVMADAKGRFSISVPKENTSLLVTAVGYDTVSYTCSAKNAFGIVIYLPARELLLEDVTVSTGYQTLSKERATGAFENIDNKLLNRSVSFDILSRLDGIAGSIYFNKVTGNRQIFIRGLSTVRGNTEPLIVLDNFPYEGDINNIDPDNIESVTILKDAAAASIWGARAGNGVIVITTRKGKYNQLRSLWLNSNITIESKPCLFAAKNYMAPADFIEVEKFLFKKGFYNADLLNKTNYPVISPAVELMDKQRSGLISAAQLDAALTNLGTSDLRNDYLKYLYRPAVTQQYSMGLSGGTNNVNYMLGFGYDRKLTTLTGNEGYRANVTAQLSSKLLPRLELQTAINYTLASDTYNGMSAIVPGGSRSSMYPYAKLADNAGNSLSVVKDYRTGYTDTAGTGYLLNWKYLPLDEIRNGDNAIGRNDMQLRVGLKYDFTKCLSAEVKGQLEKTNEVSEYYYNSNTYYSRNIVNRFTQRVGDIIVHNVPLGGILDKTWRELFSAGVRGQLNYSADLGKEFVLTAIAGAEVRKVYATGQSTRTYGYDDQLINFSTVNYDANYTLWDKLGTANIDRFADFSNTDNRYVSGFFNTALSYKNRYTFSASARKDASNLFGVNTNQKWNPFWSGGVAWKIASEPFYHVAWLPFLRARLTYGYSGSIMPGLSGKPVISYSSNTVIPVPYANAVTPGNPDLRWEKTGTLNAGIDFALKKDRISGTVDFYAKKSTDLFSYVPVDPTIGINPVMLNAANLTSTGFNIKLNTIIMNRRFKWELQLLMDHVKNRVTKYFNESSNKGAYAGFSNVITPLQGKDPYAIISYKWAGLDPLTGDPQGYLNGAISKNYTSLTRPASFDDLSIKGTSRPTYYGSIRNVFSYKGFSLSANISYTLGYYFRRAAINYNALFRNWVMNAEYPDRWQKPGDELITAVPSMIYPSNTNRDNFYAYSEATVEKGDNIRLRDIQAGYKFSGLKIKSNFIKNSEMYFYAANLGILWRANKIGVDPDYSRNIPPPVSISFGFKTNL